MKHEHMQIMNMYFVKLLLVHERAKHETRTRASHERTQTYTHAKLEHIKTRSMNVLDVLLM